MKITYLFILLILPLSMHCQQLFDTKARLTVQSGIDPASMLTFRYEHKFDEAVLKKDIYPFLEFSSSLTRFGIENSEIKLGQRMPVLEYGKLKLISGLNTSYGRAHTINFDSKKIAIAGDLALGFFGIKGFFAFTAAYEKILALKLEHSQYYRDRFYDDAKDAWYKGAGGTFQFGIEGGVLIGRKIDIYMEMKVPSTEKLNLLMGSPAHINLGISYRL